MDTKSLNLTCLPLLVLLLLLTGCKKEPEVVALNEQPRILSMSLPGIDQQNISIDQQTYTITVLLHSTLPALEMIPSFTVFQQTSLYGDWGTGKKTVSLAYYCPCTYDEQGKVGLFKAIEPVRVDNLVRTSYYTIILKSKGDPLRIKPLSSPIIYESKGKDYDIIVPVENYYCSAFIQAIAVTKTGSTSTNWIGGGFCFEQCAGRLNELVIPLGGYSGTGTLKPGLHDLDLWLADDTKVHAEGYILVK